MIICGQLHILPVLQIIKDHLSANEDPHAPAQVAMLTWQIIVLALMPWKLCAKKSKC